MAKKRVLPRVHLLAICDDLRDHTDEVASFDLFGVRSHILAPEFPHHHEQLYVYLQVTEHEGTALCRVIIVDAETDEELASAPAEVIRLSGPLDFVHVYFEFPNCVYPQAGVYYVQVYFDGTLCGERALTLIEQETGSNGQTS